MCNYKSSAIDLLLFVTWGFSWLILTTMAMIAVPIPINPMTVNTPMETNKLLSEFIILSIVLFLSELLVLS